MCRNGVLLLPLVLLLFTVDCYGQEMEVDTMNTSKTLEVSGGQKLDVNSVKVDEEKRNKDSDGELQGETSKDLERDRTGKGISEAGSAFKTVPKKIIHDEECDASNKCVDEKNKFVACLRVPGKDSPTLSLLIQNKGTGSLTINIITPDSVTVEQNPVQLLAEEEKKVEVSFENGVIDNTLIFLSAGDSRCNLSYKGESFPVPAYTYLYTYASFIYLSLAAVVLYGVAWLFVRFRRTHQWDGSRYQKMGTEPELPISIEENKETVSTNNWENNWEDSWDDEEAPKTPQKTVLTPSSKGLASRRSNKDGWKD